MINKKNKNNSDIIVCNFKRLSADGGTGGGGGRKR